MQTDSQKDKENIGSLTELTDSKTSSKNEKTDHMRAPWSFINERFVLVSFRFLDNYISL